MYAPVVNYWPEYGQQGKEATEVRHFLSHTAALPGFDPAVKGSELYDWDLCVANIEAQEPWWKIGEQSGYHAATQGFLIGEVVRRVSGKSIGRFFNEEVATPLGADFHIGVDPGEFHRIGQMIPDEAPPPPGDNPFADMEPGSIVERLFNSQELEDDAVHTAAWRQAEIPAANGHGNARSVVRAQTALANGGRAFGVDLLSAAGCQRILDEQIDGPDLGVRVPAQVRDGICLSLPEAVGTERHQHVLGRRRRVQHRGGPGTPRMPVLRDEPHEQLAHGRYARHQSEQGRIPMPRLTEIRATRGAVLGLPHHPARDVTRTTLPAAVGKDASPVAYQRAESVGCRIRCDGTAVTGDVQAADLVRRKSGDERPSPFQRREPTPLQVTQSERRPEREPVQILLCVRDVARRVLQQELRREAGVLAARRPGQGAEREMHFIKMQDVDEIANFAPSRQRQDLVDRGVRVMQAIPEAVVFLNRIEAESAVLGPLDLQRAVLHAHHGAMEGWRA